MIADQTRCLEATPLKTLAAATFVPVKGGHDLEKVLEKAGSVFFGRNGHGTIKRIYHAYEQGSIVVVRTQVQGDNFDADMRRIRRNATWIVVPEAELVDGMRRVPRRRVLWTELVDVTPVSHYAIPDRKVEVPRNLRESTGDERMSFAFDASRHPHLVDNDAAGNVAAFPFRDLRKWSHGFSPALLCILLDVPVTQEHKLGEGGVLPTRAAPTSCRLFLLPHVPRLLPVRLKHLRTGRQGRSPHADAKYLTSPQAGPEPRSRSRSSRPAALPGACWWPARQ
eukprot:scaffold535_cov260-Pinguiococcus_pyrenoidosus.AAC.18